MVSFSRCWGGGGGGGGGGGSKVVSYKYKLLKSIKVIFSVSPPVQSTSPVQ